MAPLLVPTLPVSCDIPVLPTAPPEVKNTKSAVVPKSGWAKLIYGANNKVMAIAKCSGFFMKLDGKAFSLTLTRYALLSWKGYTIL